LGGDPPAEEPQLTLLGNPEILHDSLLISDCLPSPRQPQ
jgi:hypothetical protein